MAQIQLWILLMAPICSTKHGLHEELWKKWNTSGSVCPWPSTSLSLAFLTFTFRDRINLRRVLRTEALVQGWSRVRQSGPTTSLLDTSSCMPGARDFRSLPCLCTGFWLKKHHSAPVRFQPCLFLQCKRTSRSTLHTWSSMSHRFIITP